MDGSHTVYTRAAIATIMEWYSCIYISSCMRFLPYDGLYLVAHLNLLHISSLDPDYLTKRTVCQRLIPQQLFHDHSMRTFHFR